MHSAFDHDDAPIDRSASDAYSTEQLQQAVQAYFSHFNDTVPLGLITAAAGTFRSRELMTSLLDRVKANAPITSWNQFSTEFQDRDQDSRRATPNSNHRQTSTEQR
jgi:hypothetical protein